MFGSNSFSNTSFGGTTFGGFGSNQTGVFGSTSTSQQQIPTGTTIKFAPLQGTDSIQKAGTNTGPSQISTRHQNISAMKEYESKSVDELRFEDYAANRKVGQPQAGFGASPFGAMQPSTSQQLGAGGSIFGRPATSNTSTFGASNLFNNSASVGPFSPLNKPATTLSSASPFQPFTANTSTAGVGQSQASPFGAPMPSKTSLFNTPATTTTSIFGNNSATVLGQTSTLGSPQQPQLFGQSNSLFGSNTGQNQTTSLFGSNTSQNQTTSLFGATSGAASTSQPFSFAPAFGQTNTGTQPDTTKSAFTLPSANSGFNFATSPTSNSQQVNSQSFNCFPTSINGTSSGVSMFLPQNESAPLSSDLLLNRLKTLPYGESSLFLDDSTPSTVKFSSDVKTTGQPKMNANTNVNLTKPASTSRNRVSSVLFDGVDDVTDDFRCARDVFIPKKSIKKLEFT